MKQATAAAKDGRAAAAAYCSGRELGARMPQTRQTIAPSWPPLSPPASSRTATWIPRKRPLVCVRVRMGACSVPDCNTHDYNGRRDDPRTCRLRGSPCVRAADEETAYSFGHRCRRVTEDAKHVSDTREGGPRRAGFTVHAGAHGGRGCLQRACARHATYVRQPPCSHLGGRPHRKPQHIGCFYTPMVTAASRAVSDPIRTESAQCTHACMRWLRTHSGRRRRIARTSARNDRDGRGARIPG
jgi:hypothetical protein